MGYVQVQRLVHVVLDGIANKSLNDQIEKIAKHVFLGKDPIAINAFHQEDVCLEVVLNPLNATVVWVKIPLCKTSTKELIATFVSNPF